MKFNNLTAYEVLEDRRIDDINSEAVMLKHKKTGARIVLLPNEDENKVFYIGFRTPPVDSTGVAHIIEHSVLCGSEKYPVKDPFVELAKGSLNTYLNALTFPDKTLYPVASCNDKDFKNLVDVYLDAVFHPNIYTNEKIFRQEGWHYEIEEKDAPLTINGVVYNEMKGAFSSPDDVLFRATLHKLFPDSPYGVESGGDPDAIPGLTYEKFLDFHGKYYHPSNSYIYLYGNADMEAYLSYFDEAYLSKFDRKEVLSEIKDQDDFTDGMHREEVVYPITAEESEEDASFISYAVSVSDSLDEKLYLAFTILDYAICASPGAPVRRALIEKGLCADVDSCYENGIKQTYFSITARNTNPDAGEEFLKTIKDVLSEQASLGIDKKAILAALNLFEFRYREADFGSYPKGLVYGLQMLDSWLYDDSKPFIHLEASDTFAFFRKEIDNGYFENLIRDYFLNPGREVLIVMKPMKGLSEQKENALKEKLETYKKSLTADEIEKIISDAAELKRYQEEPDTEEAMATLPCLSREDIGKKADKVLVEEREARGIPVIMHPLFTNGISYVRLMFDMGDLPEKLYPYAGLLKTVLSLMNTQHYGYQELNNEMLLKTGGFGGGIKAYPIIDKFDEYDIYFESHFKAFYDMVPDAMALTKELLLYTDFSDTVRLKEILAETRSYMESELMSRGHGVAYKRALSYCSAMDEVLDVVDGYEFYKFIVKLDNEFDKYKDEIVTNLGKVVATVFRPENFMVDVACEEKGYTNFPMLLSYFDEELHTEPVYEGKFVHKKEKKNEGLVCAGKVQYVCLAGNYRENTDLRYNGALSVLKNMLSYGYLWKNVRVKGGAYGCMCSFKRMGTSFFVSYRDPKLMDTVKIFREAADAVRNMNVSEKEILKGIIGAIAEIDEPLTPAGRAARDLRIYMTGATDEDVQRERDEILGADENVLRGLSKYIEAFISGDNICVVGNEGEINKCRDLFLSTDNLIK